jgi:site-specific DNA-methyltransferase (cytosine-N4-specific)
MFVKNYLQDKVENLDWDFINADTQYLTHSIHRYSGKFIPPLARQAIELLTVPGEAVLDPYCGSGTTLLECNLTGRRSIGVDLNPLAVLISKVKTTPVKESKLLDFVAFTKENLKCFQEAHQPQIKLFDTSAVRPDDWKLSVEQDSRLREPWYIKWFGEDVRRELVAIHQLILMEPDPDLRNVALVAFSDILRKSSNAHSSYPNVMFDKAKSKPPSAIPRFIRRLEEVADAVSRLSSALSNEFKPEVRQSNNRKLEIENDSIDAVITHPPYIGSIPYAEYGLLSLTWLGHDAKQLDRELTGGRRQSVNVVEQFRAGYADMINEAYRVLKPGRLLLILVGNPVVKGKRIDLTEMSKEIAICAGFTIAAAHQRSGINRRANLMGQEDLLLFQKL